MIRIYQATVKTAMGVTVTTDTYDECMKWAERNLRLRFPDNQDEMRAPEPAMFELRLIGEYGP